MRISHWLNEWRSCRKNWSAAIWISDLKWWVCCIRTNGSVPGIYVRESRITVPDTCFFGASWRPPGNKPGGISFSFWFICHSVKIRRYKSMPVHEGRKPPAVYCYIRIMDKARILYTDSLWMFYYKRIEAAFAFFYLLLKNSIGLIYNEGVEST